MVGAKSLFGRVDKQASRIDRFSRMSTAQQRLNQKSECRTRLEAGIFLALERLTRAQEYRLSSGLPPLTLSRHDRPRLRTRDE